MGDHDADIDPWMLIDASVQALGFLKVKRQVLSSRTYVCQSETDVHFSLIVTARKHGDRHTFTGIVGVRWQTLERKFDLLIGKLGDKIGLQLAQDPDRWTLFSAIGNVSANKIALGEFGPDCGVQLFTERFLGPLQRDVSDFVDCFNASRKIETFLVTDSYKSNLWQPEVRMRFVRLVVLLEGFALNDAARVAGEQTLNRLTARYSVDWPWMASSIVRDAAVLGG